MHVKINTFRNCLNTNILADDEISYVIGPNAVTGTSAKCHGSGLFGASVGLL